MIVVRLVRNRFDVREWKHDHARSAWIRAHALADVYGCDVDARSDGTLQIDASLRRDTNDNTNGEKHGIHD